MGNILTASERTRIWNGENQRRLPTKDGLVGYWPLSAKSASGTTIYDITGVNNGTAANTPAYTTGPAGVANEAMTFNGSSDKVTIGNTGVTVKTISIWADLDDNTTRDIMDFDGGTHVVSVDGSGDIVATGFTSPTIYINNVTGDPAIAAGAWTNIIITTATGFTASALVVGFETTWLDGDACKFRLYNTVKSTSEIDIIYNYELTLLPQ